MTDDELKAITEGFKHINERIADLEAKFNAKDDIVIKKDGELKFDDLPDELREPKKIEDDKSAEIKKSWFDKPLY